MVSPIWHGEHTGPNMPKHAQTGDQPPFLPIPRYAEQVVAATLGPAEAPDSDAVRRNLEAKGLELTELEFTLREVELNSDRLQQYLEQSQSNLEMQTEEKLGSPTDIGFPSLGTWTGSGGAYQDVVADHKKRVWK